MTTCAHILRKAFLPLLLGSAWFSHASAQAYQPPPSDSAQFNFNPGWKVAKGSFPIEHTDDSTWQDIATPYTYHEAEAYQGIKPGLKDLGPYTFRKHFKLPAEFAGRKIILEFQGIRQRGRFYLNGHFLGGSENGVTPFGFDLTPYLRFGDAENILHAEIDCGDTDWETGTHMSWFFPGFNSLYGGIGRDVILHVMGPVHATLPLYSSMQTTGAYVYAEDISTEKRQAQIGAEVQVRNDDDVARQVHCQAVVVDRDGHVAATLDAPGIRMKPGELHLFTMRKEVADLHFWQPGYPYLYDVYTVVSAEGRVQDVQRLVTGFRKIEVRGSTLYVNNRPLMTQGYTPRSQNEWPAVGSAYPDWLHDYSNAMMVAGNARMVRWEHIMPSPQDIQSCDRVGLPEIVPGADRENDSVGREWEMRKEIMRDVIIYARNNPSIFLWEAANNVLTKEHTQEMIDLRDKWDPHGYKRPMGGRCESPEWVSWMYGVRKETYRLSEDVEYMRDESPRRWWDSFSPPYFHKAGDWTLIDNAGGWNRNQDNMCLMQSIVYEQYYKARPGTGAATCNGGVQILFADSDTFTRGSDGFRRSGPVDGMRIPKDTYGCNQTMWSNTPVLWTEGKPSVYLPGHWNYPAGTVKPVYVFVSPGIDKVDLYVNGQAQPPGQRTNMFLFTFSNVAWQPGEVKAVGCDVAGRVVAQMSHETAGDPAALRLQIIQGPSGLRANGSDLALIQAEVVDAQGRRCPLAQNVVAYDVTGPVVWRGGFWEENVAEYANQKTIPVLNGVQRVIVRSTTQPGGITIRASSPGLPPAEVTLTSGPVDIRDGLTQEAPAVEPVALESSPTYGPDLPPPPPVPPGAFDKAEAKPASGLIFDLSVAFPHGAEIRHDVADGSRIFQDRDWVFAGLPDYLHGADYLLIHDDDATASAGEGVVFKIGRPGRVYVAYDDRNQHFPMVSSPTGFSKTADKIMVDGHAFTIYKSGAMNGGELTYLGTNNWTDPPAPGADNYIVFVQPNTPAANNSK